MKTIYKKCLVLAGLLSANAGFGQTITTVAGKAQGGYAGDGGNVVASQLNGPTGVCVDTAGNIYIAEWQNNRVRKINFSSGIITTVAGNGVAGFGGDGGPAASAMLNSPVSVAVDKSGNIYISDLNNYRIRKVAASTGNISTLAGTGTGTYSGDGGPSTAAGINGAYGICLDTAGNLYLAESGNHVVRKITKSTGNISTVAGNASSGYSGDGGAATFAKLSSPQSTYVDAAGNIYISDAGNKVIRKVNASTGIISTIAGSGASGYSGDGGPALAAKFGYIMGITGDAAGNLYVSDNTYNVIRKIAAGTNTISTLAGNGSSGYAGDNGPAASALLSNVQLLCVNKTGDLLLCDYSNHRVRKIDAGSGIISTIAGFIQGGYSGDGAPAEFSELNDPNSVAIDTAGNIYIAEWRNNRVRMINKITGNITTVAGNGTAGFGGDGGLATSAMLNSPYGVAVDRTGNIFISDVNNYRIRKVNKLTGNISTIAGNGSGGYTGDGGPSTSAQVNSPYGLGVDTAGNLYFADNGNNVVRKISKSSGNITTVAGNGTAGYTGDGTAATFAKLASPAAVYVDAPGNLYIADRANHAIRKVSVSSGLISTFAGNGTAGYSGNNGPATAARLSSPTGVCMDAAGNLFISESGNSVIRVVKANNGNIYQLAGSAGISGYAGDGGAPGSALFNSPGGLCADAAAHLYVADENNNRVRKMDVDLNTVGISEHRTETPVFSVFPNPSSGEFTLNLEDVKGTVLLTVQDLLGQIVLTNQLTGGEQHKIDLINQVRGIYIIQIQSSIVRSAKQLIVD